MPSSSPARPMRLVTGVPDPRDGSTSDTAADPTPLERSSTLAGPLQPAPTGPYRVEHRMLTREHGRLWRTLALAAASIVIEIAFFAWLLKPAHHPQFLLTTAAVVLNAVVIGTVAVMEVLRLVNVVSLARASVTASYPVPVEAERGTRLAFVTSFVPGKEPLDMLERTLAAARRIEDPSGLGIDVWLLDEGDDPDARRVCAELGVHHFSRRGVARWNTPRGAFRAKTKHGNYNAWLDAHGDDYDYFMSVDTDHVPLPLYAQRILGYFHDPDVAFVDGPQVYGNVADGFVTLGAESQQRPFHSTIQPAANASGGAMLVGTSNAFRISALKQVGGLADSITEDMATGLVVHTSRNPATGQRWRSVYTPDVLAVGEGPTGWGDYFQQQDRWSRGTFEVMRSLWWRRAHKLRPGQLLHYGLITTFYPSMALAWLLAAFNAGLYAFTGAAGLDVPPQAWAAFYLDATLIQVWLYVSNRRYNVSPFEHRESYGLGGMLMSVLAAPIFAGALLKTLLRMPARFAVTPKGLGEQRESLHSFRFHLAWAAFFALALTGAVVNGYATPASSVWPLAAMAICLTPLAISTVESRRRARAATAEPADGATDSATDSTAVPQHLQLVTAAQEAS